MSQNAEPDVGPLADPARPNPNGPRPRGGHAQRSRQRPNPGAGRTHRQSPPVVLKVSRTLTDAQYEHLGRLLPNVQISRTLNNTGGHPFLRAMTDMLTVYAIKSLEGNTVADIFGSPGKAGLMHGITGKDVWVMRPYFTTHDALVTLRIPNACRCSPFDLTGGYGHLCEHCSYDSAIMVDAIYYFDPPKLLSLMESCGIKELVTVGFDFRKPFLKFPYGEGSYCIRHKVSNDEPPQAITWTTGSEPYPNNVGVWHKGSKYVGANNMIVWTNLRYMPETGQAVYRFVLLDLRFKELIERSKPQQVEFADIEWFQVEDVKYPVPVQTMDAIRGRCTLQARTSENYAIHTSAVRKRFLADHVSGHNLHSELISKVSEETFYRSAYSDAMRHAKVRAANWLGILLMNKPLYWAEFVYFSRVWAWTLWMGVAAFCLVDKFDWSAFAFVFAMGNMIPSPLPVLFMFLLSNSKHWLGWGIVIPSALFACLPEWTWKERSYKKFVKALIMLLSMRNLTQFLWLGTFMLLFSYTVGQPQVAFNSTDVPAPGYYPNAILIGNVSLYETDSQLLRNDVFDHKEIKPTTFARLYGVGFQVLPFLHAKCDANESRGILTRVLCPLLEIPDHHVFAKLQQWTWNNRTSLFPNYVPTWMKKDEWLLRYQGAQRRRFVQAFKDLKLDGWKPSYYVRNVFTKLELLPPKLVNGVWQHDSDPRIISGTTPHFQAAVGRYIVSISKYLADVWNGTTVRLIYAGGDSAAKLLSDAVTRSVHSSNVFLESDGKRWDRHFGELSGKFVHWLYEYIFLVPPSVMQILKHRAETVAYSHYFKFTPPPMRFTGDADTSVGNTLFRGLGDMFTLAEMNVSFQFIAVMGDDGLSSVREDNLSVDTYIEAWAKLGQRMVSSVHPNLEQATFCSKIFVPTLNQSGEIEYRISPLIGKMISKIGWTHTPGAKWAATVEGLAPLIAHCPISRALLSHRSGKPVKVQERLTNEKEFPCIDLAYEFVCHRYDLSLEQVKSFEEALRVAKPGELLVPGILETLLDVDL